MSTLDSRVARDRKAMLAFLGVGVFCVVLAVVYAQFSHGVSSMFMSLCCMVPYAGAVVYLFMVLTGRHPLDRLAFNAFNAALATFTVASVLRAVFDIAGTSSVWLMVLVVAGALLLLAACVSIVRHTQARGRV